MNFTKNIKQVLSEDRVIRGENAIDELKRHASVSTDNRHYCKDCFCCACVDFLAKSIHEQAVMMDCEIDSHAKSDLYIKVTPLSQELVKGYKYPCNVERFISQIDNKPWFEVPFEFEPDLA
jgi:hypothetical protein